MAKPKPLKGYVERTRARLESGELPVHNIRQPTYTPCKPDCEVCQGRAFFTYDVPVGHPEFGKLQRCPHAPINAKVSGLSKDELDNMEWNDIINEGDAYKAKAVVLDVLDKGYGWVYLFGNPGRAKTLILKRLVKDALSQQKTAKYAQTSHVLDWLRESFDEERKQFTLNSRMDELYKTNVLCLDEFDRFNSTDWANQQIQMLMNARYEGAIYERNITVMASNSSPSIYEPYLKDRIYDGRFTVLHLTGDSLRPAADQLGV